MCKIILVKTGPNKTQTGTPSMLQIDTVAARPIIELKVLDKCLFESDVRVP